MNTLCTSNFSTIKLPFNVPAGNFIICGFKACFATTIVVTPSISMACSVVCVRQWCTPEMHSSLVTGALADALEAIANQAHLLHPSTAADFSRRLLALFTDVTVACKPLQQGPPLDSVALLPALASACEAARSTAVNGAAAGAS